MFENKYSSYWLSFRTLPSNSQIVFVYGFDTDFSFWVSNRLEKVTSFLQTDLD